jgi:hypothetical protein
MAALADYAAYKTEVASPYLRVQAQKNSVAPSVNGIRSLWLLSPFAGVAPTTAVVPTRTLAGALDPEQFWNGGSGELRLAQGNMCCRYSMNSGNTAEGGMMILCDRLSHQAGLSGTVTTGQTTNLPTAALTRYTTGENVIAAFEIYTAVGATATSITCSYTNQAGTAGQISIAQLFGSSPVSGASRLLPISLVSGDTGVRSVESVTVLATTGTAGNFGVILLRPLVAFPLISFGATHYYDAMLTLGGNMPEVVDDACLCWYYFNYVGGADAVGPWQANLTFIET